MQWVPETIRALTDMLKEVGPFAGITFTIGMTFIIGMLGLMWKFGADLIMCVRGFLANQKETNEKAGVANLHLGAQTEAAQQQVANQQKTLDVMTAIKDGVDLNNSKTDVMIHKTDQLKSLLGSDPFKFCAFNLAKAADIMQAVYLEQTGKELPRELAEIAVKKNRDQILHEQEIARRSGQATEHVTPPMAPRPA